jgi:hypothetical protein
MPASERSGGLQEATCAALAPPAPKQASYSGLHVRLRLSMGTTHKLVVLGSGLTSGA